MLIEIRGWEHIDERKLMDIYHEGNMENTAYFYPDVVDGDEALRKVEHDFLGYIKNEFLDSRNRYMVLENEGSWVSALRLYWIRDRFYYIEALETHPDHRKKGHASRLLSGVLNELKRQGPFTVCDCVGKRNTASLATHLKCGFVIADETGYNYLQGTSNEREYGMRFTYGELHM